MASLLERYFTIDKNGEPKLVLKEGIENEFVSIDEAESMVNEYINKIFDMKERQ